jgi:hypothetical protein
LLAKGRDRAELSGTARGQILRRQRAGVTGRAAQRRAAESRSSPALLDSEEVS